MKTEYELLIQNYNGQTWEMSELTEKVTLNHKQRNSASELSFTWHKDDKTSFHEGDAVRFSVNGQALFTGRIFTKEKDRYNKFAVTCYDSIRYLKYSDSKSFEAMSASEIITRIASEQGLQTGEIEDTGYKIPYLIFQGKTYLDMICAALEQTIMNTGKIFVFYDNAGKLTLKEAVNMRVPEVIGVKSLATDYTYKTDIDKETYNQIKLARPNEQTGRADVYITRDSDTISRWGTLQYYKVVDENMNAAQIQQEADTMLSYYNRKLRTLTLDRCIGVPTIRAGSMVMFNIPKLGDINLNSFLLVESAEHYFTNSLHLMDLECKIPIK